MKKYRPHKNLLMSHPLVVGGIRKSKNKSPYVEFLVQLIKKKRIAFFSFPSIFSVKIFFGLRREFLSTGSYLGVCCVCLMKNVPSVSITS